MAIYHLSMKTVSRSAGRSTTAAAAYRAGVKIVDRRTGEIHDYTRKSGVLGAAVVLPQGGTMPRAELWNRVEEHHKRRDAVLAREIVIALPAELNQEDRERLALKYARELADKYGVAVDVALHAPSKDGSDKNWHAHIMLTACHVSPQGELGKKCVALDPIHCKKHKLPSAADVQREHWADLANAALAEAGQDARIDHRSHAERGLEELPSYHLGPEVTAILRRGGRSTVVEREDAKRSQAHTNAAQELDTARAELAAAQAELKELERLEAFHRQQRAAEQEQRLMEQVEHHFAREAELDAWIAQEEVRMQREADEHLELVELRELAESLRDDFQNDPDALQKLDEVRAMPPMLEAQRKALEQPKQPPQISSLEAFKRANGIPVEPPPPPPPPGTGVDAAAKPKSKPKKQDDDYDFGR